jgi:hypothetical protein
MRGECETCLPNSPFDPARLPQSRGSGGQNETCRIRQLPDTQLALGTRLLPPYAVQLAIG